MKYKDCHFKVKAVQEDGFFSGYASVFGNEDSYGDIVIKGAFAETIADWQERGKMPPVLWNHKTDEPIGVYTLLKEDEKGLYVEGRLLVKDVVRAREIHALMKAGAVDGMSIGYSPVEYNYDKETNITELLKLKLWENSIVVFPANDLSRVEAVKSKLQAGELPTLPEFEKFLRDAGFSKSQATAIAGHGLRHLLGEPAKSDTAIKNALTILQGKDHGSN